MRNFISKIFRLYKTTILFWLDLGLNLIFVLVTVYIIRSFIISLFIVSGPSMCDTLNYIYDQCQRGNGEIIIVNKAVYQNFLGWRPGSPKRGDIIVFHPPQNKDEFFIKRIVGLPGETAQLKNGDVYISNKENPKGFKMEEPYLNEKNRDNTHPFRESDTVFKIPEDGYFVLGDNRTASSDSRSCFKESIVSGGCGQNGNTPFLKQKNIEGKAWIILWPINKLGFL